MQTTNPNASRNKVVVLTDTQRELLYDLTKEYLEMVASGSEADLIIGVAAVLKKLKPTKKRATK
jgi:DNA-binding MarR family transcriptional regulator